MGTEYLYCTHACNAPRRRAAPVMLRMLVLSIFMHLATLCEAYNVAACGPAISVSPKAMRSADVFAVVRSKEEQANIEKWGKILSQADTFDDTMKIRRKKGAPVQDKNRGGAIVVLGSGAAVLAMALSQVGH